MVHRVKWGTWKCLVFVGSCHLDQICKDSRLEYFNVPIGSIRMSKHQPNDHNDKYWRWFRVCVCYTEQDDLIKPGRCSLDGTKLRRSVALWDTDHTRIGLVPIVLPNPRPYKKNVWPQRGLKRAAFNLLKCRKKVFLNICVSI